MSRIVIPEGVRLIGEATFILEGPAGRRVHVYRNRLTNYFLQALVQWMTGTANVGVTMVPIPSQTQLGTGSNVSGPQPTDTALWTPTAGTLRSCAAIGPYQTYYGQWTSQYSTSDPSGTFLEAGLLDVSGNLHAHVATNISKTASDALTLIWKVLTTGN